jgi:hypothetical protein
MRLRNAATVLLLIALVAAGAVWLAQRRWSATSEELVCRLQSAPRPKAVAYSPSELESLPAPVARYFRRVLSDGRKVVARVRIAWQGEFNTGRPGKDRWCPFTATQVYAPAAPGYVWSARIAMPQVCRYWCATASSAAKDRCAARSSGS